jgi:hypothetical protein
MILIGLDFGVGTAVCSDVLAEHEQRDVHDVFRIREPRQGIVKIAKESVWAVAGVQT